MDGKISNESTNMNNLENGILNDYLCMNYAPLTPVDVKRSFFTYKKILSPKCFCCSEDSLLKYGSAFFFFLKSNN